MSISTRSSPQPTSTSAGNKAKNIARANPRKNAKRAPAIARQTQISLEAARIAIQDALRDNQAALEAIDEIENYILKEAGTRYWNINTFIVGALSNSE